MTGPETTTKDTSKEPWLRPDMVLGIVFGMLVGLFAGSAAELEEWHDVLKNRGLVEYRCTDGELIWKDGSLVRGYFHWDAKE